MFFPSWLRWMEYEMINWLTIGIIVVGMIGWNDEQQKLGMA